MHQATHRIKKIVILIPAKQGGVSRRRNIVLDLRKRRLEFLGGANKISKDIVDDHEKREQTVAFSYSTVITDNKVEDEAMEWSSPNVWPKSVSELMTKTVIATPMTPKNMNGHRQPKCERPQTL
ncbi:hypothetical protein A2U01_0021271 [Trifolium medium]|uniref:Uncharacterized protein n=1 Tax=Trifolium medium TaxID=97028 RepID=A0A392NLJ2_9FABA|nr:hypothetical protein [Trifolium medium]